MSGHKHVWVQTCVAQSCLVINVSGHKRVGSSMHGHKRVVSRLNNSEGQ